MFGCVDDTIAQPEPLPKGYKNWYIGDFRCGVFVPPSYDPKKKYPLVIYLHGHSDTTSWNFGWYHEPVALQDPAIVLTPKCPRSETGGWGTSTSEILSPMMVKTFEIIEQVKKQYAIDEQRIYIHGTSMGAIGTFGLIKRFPDMFTAGYALCGWATPAMAPELSKVPFWIFHGELDDVVPVEGSRGIYNAVVAGGGKQIRYTEFKGVKHDAWNYVNDSKVYTWLLKQRKGDIHKSPAKVAGVDVASEDNAILINWHRPANVTINDDEVWFYKIYRDNVLVGEVENDLSKFIDMSAQKGKRYTYTVAAINYYFKESESSTPATIVF